MAHVPKFGSWDKDNIPYTAYFENARKEKSGVKMNPNDPEENPEAFMYGRGGMEIDVDVSFSQSTPAHHKSIYAEKQQVEGHGRHNSQSRNPSDHQKVASQKSITSESASDKSNSDYSLLQAGHRREKPNRRTAVASEASKSFTSSAISKHYRQKSGTHPSDVSHRKAASVPKFGAWDETDPKSGEGFTATFNRVKQERQITSAAFQSGPPQTRNYVDGNRNHESSSTGSKGPEWPLQLLIAAVKSRNSSLNLKPKDRQLR